MIDNIFVEAHIADIHFGAIDPNLQYNILNEQFLEYLQSLQILDIISINGDIFDHKFLANSDSVMYAHMLISRLINICNEKGATLIIIAGTASHDAGQLKLFYPYLDKTDIRIVEDVKFEYIKNKKVLIIPELYNKGTAYYRQYLNQIYDACYMHGTFKGSVYGKDVGNLNSDREPVFSIEDFSGCKGPIISGHVHKPQCLKEHFYYCGSPYRWQFGEEEEKGFIILIHDIINRRYHTHFEPIKSFRYDTYNLDDMLHSNPQKLIEWIKKRKEEGIDNIRIKFTENDETNLPIIKSYFRNTPWVKIDANFKNEAIINEVNDCNQRYKEYDFIFDKSASPYEILSKYINHQEKDTFITTEDLIALVEENL